MNASFEAREPSAAPPAPRYPSPPAAFEFNAAQETLIASLGKLMFWVGLVSAIFGGLVGLVSLMANPLVGLIQGGLMIVVGLLTMAAGSHFRKVAETIGSDIPHLMQALDKLRTLYLVQIWALGIALVFMALAFVYLAVVIASR